MAGILIQWYDFICFGIVGIAMSGALYVLCCCKIKQQRYQTLNGDHIDDHNIVGGHEILLPQQGCNQSASPSAVEIGNLSSRYWRGIHPVWLLATRFVSLVVLCIFLTWDVLLYNYSIFVYYTEWTFTLLIVYFAIGTIISAYGCVQYYSNKSAPRPGDVIADHEIYNKAKTNKSMFKRQGQYYNEDTVPQRASFWTYVLQISYQTCAGSVILTDIVFWFIILPYSSNSHLQLNLLMGGMHSLNIIFLLIETSLNSLPLPWSGLAYFVLWSCCYVIFQWLVHACGLICCVVALVIILVVLLLGMNLDTENNLDTVSNRVALPLFGTFNAVGSSMVLLLGGVSLTLLWNLLVVCRFQKLNVLYIVPPGVCKTLLLEWEAVLLGFRI